MKAEHEIKKTVTLILDENEAEWLKGLVQNPFLCEQCHESVDFDRINPENDKIRKTFWQALTQTSDDDL